MDDEEVDVEKILIVSDYPHPILMHIRKSLGKRKRDFLQDESLFLTDFRNMFPQESGEYNILQTAYRLNIIHGFFQNVQEPDWKKRVYIQKSLFAMQKEMRECDAVALLESLMNVFQWNFPVEAKRKWKVAPENKANFHSFQKPEQARTDNSFHEETKQRQRRQRRQESALRSRRRRTLPDEEILSPPSPSSPAPRKNARQASHADQASQDDFPYDEVDEVLDALGEDQPDKKYNIFIIEDSRQITSPQEMKYYSKMRMADRKHIKKAIAGNEKSQCYLGDFYSEENSDHLDYPEAVYWYQLSANQGNYKARMQLATIYDSGVLKDQDTKKRGLECYRQLAEEGFPTAQCILGMKYFFGDGVEENRSIAMKWLKKSAAQGHDEAIKLLERFMH